MTGLLRFIGLLNAAIWFGAAVYFTLGAGPAVFSPEVKELLGAHNYPYYSTALARVVIGRYYYLQFACGLVALLHLLAEWLYFGQSPARLRLGLLVGLVALSMLGNASLQPRLKQVTLQYTQPQTHQAAERAFQTWQDLSLVVNCLTVAGLAVYLWRVANPKPTTRFAPTANYRG